MVLRTPICMTCLHLSDMCGPNSKCVAITDDEWLLRLTNLSLVGCDQSICEALLLSHSLLMFYKTYTFLD